MPFEWGRTDCGSLVRAALVLMFGAALDERLPRWDSRSSALRALASVGSVADLLCRLGAEPRTLPFLRAGDVLVREEDSEVGRVALMVCVDGRRCLASTPNGVVWADAPDDARVLSLWGAVVA